MALDPEVRSSLEALALVRGSALQILTDSMARSFSCEIAFLEDSECPEKAAALSKAYLEEEDARKLAQEAGNSYSRFVMEVTNSILSQKEGG